MSRLPLVILGIAIVAACGQEGAAPPPSEPPTPPESSETTMATTQVRPTPGPVVIDDDTQERLRALYSEMRGGGGGGSITPAQEHFSNLSNERAYALSKQMIAAGRAANPNDPCARVLALYDVVASNNPHEMPKSREEVLEECRNEPRAFSACLKAENERTPSERRRCARLLDRDPYGSPESPDATMEIGVRPPADVDTQVRQMRRRQSRMR